MLIIAQRAKMQNTNMLVTIYEAHMSLNRNLLSLEVYRSIQLQSEKYSQIRTPCPPPPAQFKFNDKECQVTK